MSRKKRERLAVVDEAAITTVASFELPRVKDTSIWLRAINEMYERDRKAGLDPIYGIFRYNYETGEMGGLARNDE